MRSPIAAVCAMVFGLLSLSDNSSASKKDNVLPELGGNAPVNNDAEKRVAEIAKGFGERSMAESSLDTGEQFRQYAITQLGDYFSSRFTSRAQDLLSPWGNLTLDLHYGAENGFTGTNGALFTPWLDADDYLTWSELGFTATDKGTAGNLGVGQRWRAGHNWLLGYNTFYDSLLGDDQDRLGFGAEIWGDYLRFSANYYQPLSDWHSRHGVQEQRLARGYDVSAKAWLPFYRHISTSVSLEHYFGEQVDLFNSGTGYRNPLAVTLGINYTPIPLLTLTARHQQGENGVTQDNVGVQINYRFGVALEKQLAAANVAIANSLAGSRYDRTTRSSVPVLEYRTRKTLSAYLATPPWSLTPGESVELKLQVKARHGIRRLSWQGDTHELSLTPPSDPTRSDGWTVIIPMWNSEPGAANSWRLSVIVEDQAGQQVTSNWITLSATEPMLIWPAAPVLR